MKGEVVVLGGGFAGLRIAQLLAQNDYHVIIIEKQPFLGGMVTSFKKIYQNEAYYFDYGPHLFFPEYKNNYYELIKNDLESITGIFGMQARGKQLRYPIRISDILLRLNPLFSTACFSDFLISRLFRSKKFNEKSSVKDFMVTNFGKILFDSFYRPYIEKAVGLRAEEISLNWAYEREHVSGSSLGEVIVQRLKRVLTRKDKNRYDLNLPSSNNIVFYYPRKGAIQLIEAMAEEIQRKGGTIYCEAKVKKIVINNNIVKEIQFETSDDNIKEQADYYISTIPIPDLFRIISPKVDNNLLEHARQLKYRKLLLLNLIINKDSVLKKYVEIFSMEEDAIFKRIYEPKVLSKEMAPKGKTSLCLEICYSDGEAIATYKDSDIFDIAISKLEQMKILGRKDVLSYFTVHLDHAYPIYHIGYQESLTPLIKYLSNIPNLIITGRQGLFRYHTLTNEIMEISKIITDLIISKKTKNQIDKTDKWGKFFY
jgi:protoporphyrinogen oxidase